MDGFIGVMAFLILMWGVASAVMIVSQAARIRKLEEQQFATQRVTEATTDKIYSIDRSIDSLNKVFIPSKLLTIPVDKSPLLSSYSIKTTVDDTPPKPAPKPRRSRKKCPPSAQVNARVIEL